MTPPLQPLAKIKTPSLLNLLMFPCIDRVEGLLLLSFCHSTHYLSYYEGIVYDFSMVDDSETEWGVDEFAEYHKDSWWGVYQDEVLLRRINNNMVNYTRQQMNILAQAEVKHSDEQYPQSVAIGHFVGDSEDFKIYAHLRKGAMKQEAFNDLIQSVVKSIKKDTGINNLNVLHREDVQEVLSLGSDY